MLPDFKKMVEEQKIKDQSLAEKTASLNEFIIYTCVKISKELKEKTDNKFYITVQKASDFLRIFLRCAYNNFRFHFLGVSTRVTEKDAYIDTELVKIGVSDSFQKKYGTCGSSFISLKETDLEQFFCDLFSESYLLRETILKELY